MIEDAHNIFRLVWHSFDFEPDGTLKLAAFTSADLRPETDEHGAPKFISTDLAMLMSKDSVDWRIKSQQADGKTVTLRRIEARFAEFAVRRLRAVQKNGIRQFEVTSEPDAVGAGGYGSPENLAHCALRHISGFSGSRGEVSKHVNFLRTELIKQILSIREYGDLFPPKA